MKSNKRSLSVKIIFFIIQLSVILAGTLAAQSPSGNGLKGVILDEAKAVIPGAAITLQDPSGRKISVVAGDDGSFDFGTLPNGRYTLTVRKEGFADVERTVEVGTASAGENITLGVAAQENTVTVVMDSADAAVESTLKNGLTLHETPRTVAVIGSERIREQNFQQVSDVLSYVPGTSQNSFRNGSYHFYSRGYRMGPEDTRVDGFAGVNVGSGGFGASMFGIEEAVVLKGPASLIYGQTGSPGGLINLVSKRPQENYFTRLDLRTASYAGNGVSLGDRPSVTAEIDSTGTLFGDGRVLYRGIAAIENTSYFTKDTSDRNRYVNGSLSFKLDENGQYVLTPSAQYTRYFRPFGGGVVISPSSSLSAGTVAGDPSGTTVVTDDLSPLDVNLFGGRRIEETGWAGLDFRGVVSDRIRVNAAYRYVSFDTDINSFTPQATSTAQIARLRNEFTISRVQAKSLTERNYHNANADVSYEWLSTPNWRNTTQAGFYIRSLDSRTTTPRGAIPAAQSPINIYTGIALNPLADNFPAIAFGAFGRDTVTNLFVQNRTALRDGRVHFTVGFSVGQQNPVTGATRKSGLVPNASVVFNATPQLAIYGSYATSFNPIDPNFEDEEGRIGSFGPTLGRNYEVGVKYDLLNRRASLAFALFQNQIDNAVVLSDVGVLNINSNRYYIPAGTRRARGAELTGSFQVLRDVNIRGGVAYTSALYLGFPNGAPASTSPIPNSWAEKTPKLSYNLYTRYDKREGALQGFGAGLGIVYQGKRLGSNGARTFANPDPLVLPSFTRVDAALFYRLNKRVNFALNVDNVFDELIFVNASVGSNIEIAAPRTANFRTTFNF